MGLQVSRLVGKAAEAGRVGFVEAIGRKAGDVVEDAVGDEAIHALSDGAPDKLLPQLLHLPVRAVRGHGPAQQVALSQGEARHGLRDLQHMLLVDDDPVAGPEHRLQRRVQIGDRLQAMLARDVRADHVRLHRAGAEQRDIGDDLFELMGLRPPQQVALAGAFDLEEPNGLRRAQEAIGRRVVQRQGLRVQPVARAPLNLRQAIRDGGVDAQAQDVHLQQAECFDVILIKGADDDALVGQLQGHEVRERLRADDQPADVDAQVARVAADLVA